MNNLQPQYSITPTHTDETTGLDSVHLNSSIDVMPLIPYTFIAALLFAGAMSLFNHVLRLGEPSRN